MYKKIFSWILVLALFLQLLTPIGVQAENREYFIINKMEAAPGEPYHPGRADR
ncbi:MAG TPA: hypothetical protein PKU88_11485 [Bacillota bacterium]|nr:hypothetical protein [Bacillota bacterium]HNT04109.1 hypothetical protein [Bacillota bacterium]HPX69931.1 hypothetical protein [Bacillota bacterium]HQA66380.1 hypothetical protein [Bacillota bacterium]